MTRDSLHSAREGNGPVLNSRAQGCTLAPAGAAELFPSLDRNLVHRRKDRNTDGRISTPV